MSEAIEAARGKVVAEARYLTDKGLRELLAAVDHYALVVSASAQPMAGAQEAAKLLPDPLGCRACVHPDCGRFNGPRQVECRAMADNACARQQGAPEASAAPVQEVVPEGAPVDQFGRTPDMIRFQNMLDAGDEE